MVVFQVLGPSSSWVLWSSIFRSIEHVMAPAREPASRSNGEWRNPGQMAPQLDSLRPPGEA